MAPRFLALIPSAGAVAAALIAAIILGTLARVALHAGGLGALGEWDLRAIWFTLWQAALSAAISVALAVPAARALARRRFAGRRLLVMVLGAPFILPVLVAVMGLVAIFGRNGWVNAALGAMGLPEFSIYGWHGVVLAHVFFNLPLTTRLVLHGWQSIPSERFRLAATLGFAPRDIARHLERPMLREVLPGAFVAVFLVCLTSFAVALALGGGPRATTIELAIYQAFRFDFDMGRAASLGLVQVGLCALAMVASLRLTRIAAFGAGLDRAPVPLSVGGWRRGADAVVIAAAALFLLAPLGAVIASGLAGLGDLGQAAWAAAGRSVVMALISAALCLAVSLAMALRIARADRQERIARLIEAAGLLPIIASPLVLGTGLFLLLRPITSPDALALPVTVGINALMALPFALRVLIPAARQLERDYGRLAASLGLRGWARLRLLALPRLAQPLGFAGGLTAALAMGDLGVITLFASPDRATLPLRLYQLMGAYRMDEASACALLLMGLSLGLFYLFEKGARHVLAFR